MRPSLLFIVLLSASGPALAGSGADATAHAPELPADALLRGATGGASSARGPRGEGESLVLPGRLRETMRVLSAQARLLDGAVSVFPDRESLGCVEDPACVDGLLAGQEVAELALELQQALVSQDHEAAVPLALAVADYGEISFETWQDLYAETDEIDVCRARTMSGGMANAATSLLEFLCRDGSLEACADVRVRELPRLDPGVCVGPLNETAGH